MPGEDITSWSKTAANNDTADTSINWREGMARAAVNDSSRSEMAAHAKSRDLTNGSIVTGGTANAQTFISGVSYTAIPTNLRVLLKIGPTLTNTATATLNMDAIANTPIKSRFGVDLVAGELVADSYSEFRYDGTNWVLLSIGATILATTIVTPPAGSITTNNLITNTIAATGAITAASLTTTGGIASATLTTTGNISTNGGSFFVDGIMGVVNYGTARNFNFHGTDFCFSWQVASPNYLYLYMGATPKFTFTPGGDALRPGGGPWSDSSDLRIKDVIGDYTSGLTEICALAPIRYTFKGNDGEHAADGKEYIGLIAQDVEASMPEMVTMKAGKIDGKPVTDLRVLDTTALIYALVNSVQDLAARIQDLEAKG